MRSFRALSVLVSVLLALSACSGAAPAATPATAGSAPTSAPASATKPAAAITPAAVPTPPAKVKRGGTITTIETGDTNSMDPILVTSGPVVEGSPALEALLGWTLVDEKTGKHEITPELAESFQMVDPKTIVLKIRKGVKFHDGSELNAEVAKWNMDRNRSHPKSMGKSFYRAIDTIDIVDPYTLQINLKFTSATILLNMTRSATGSGSSGALLVSKAHFDKVGEEEMAKRAVGTGPFEMAEWKRDYGVTYKKFGQYWKKGADGEPLPYLDSINVRVIPDQAVGLVELKAGSAHVARQVAERDIAEIKSNPNLNIMFMPWSSWRRTLGFNQENPVWGKNLKLRQAAQYALDREALAKTLGFGYAQADYYHLWIPSYPGWDEKAPKYDFNLDKAKQLITESGVSNPTITLLSSPPVGSKVAELIQAMWGKAGIQTTLEVMDSITARQKVKNGNFEAHESNMAGSPDPDQWTRMYTCDGSANWSNYCNKEMDKCMAEGGAEYDFAKRDAIYKRCLKILYDDALVFGTYMYPVNAVYRKEVKNLIPAQHLVDIREAWLDK